MAQNLKDLAGRLPAGPRGMGTALKLLLGAGAVAYGVRESVFTGEQPSTSRTSRSPDPLDCTHTHTRAHTHPQGVRTYLLLHPRLTCADQQPVLIPTPLSTVEGGHRAIFFNRIGGVQQDTILAEGLHFR